MELCYRGRPLVLWDWLIVFFLQVKCDSTGQHFKTSEALRCYYLLFAFYLEVIIDLQEVARVMQKGAVSPSLRCYFISSV